MVSDRLKDIIFKKLYKELSKVEIIPYMGSVYFIDRDNKYWYFEYEKEGKLWYRYDFFNNFFVLFSLDWYEYEKVMGEWVEEVINCKVTTIITIAKSRDNQVEEVINCKVTTISSLFNLYSNPVEEVINCKVTKIVGYHKTTDNVVEEVLAHKDDVTI
jgi:hypothetical protein